MRLETGSGAEKRGCVLLVGAGPGRGALTLRGLQAIRRADVICHDDLIDHALLSYAPPSCEIVAVGKRHGRHSMEQQEITRLLICKAREGRVVVRLKGGDSFVFGRGSEEVLALRENGIAYEVIPGVSSAIAVPEVLGIPVTHRGMAAAFTVVTGHGADGRSLDYAALARMPGTLIFLMGMHHIGEITRHLIMHGKAPRTPAAVLCRGMMDGARRIDGPLEHIAALAQDAPTPGILLVGEVAALHMEKTLQRPLEEFCGDVFGNRFSGKWSPQHGELRLRKRPKGVPFYRRYRRA
ncbi:MAG: uroporphyrinogen-III C-methyltransferase [Deltaproteobacteria bacterium]|nr:uroporphyrinogen-III C-methyltransferase [Deltaproteobacteria bacterium]